MKNRMTVSLPFSFKGKEHCPRSTIDLDEHMQKFGFIPCLYTLVANENGIDIYSYEHDVMMMARMEFSNVEGIAADFIHDHQFDGDGFESRWHEQKRYETLQDISQRLMNLSDLSSQPELEAALTEAYETGRSTGKAEKVIHSTTDPLF